MKAITLIVTSTLLAGRLSAQPATPSTNAAAATPSMATRGAAAPFGTGNAQPAAASVAASGTNSAQPSITTEYGTNGLRINFHGAPLNLVLDYLSDAAGFIINKTTDVHGTVEIWSKQPVTKEEAVDLLSSALNRNGYAVVRNGRILTILPLDTAKTSSQLEVVTGSDPNSVPDSDEMETRIIPVHYASASQLVPNLELLLPTSATLTANESANTLILVATKSDIKRMLKIVQALDTSIATVSTIKVRQLQYADAKDTATLITQLFSSQNSNQGGQGGPQNFGGPGGRGGFFFRAMAQAAAANANKGGNPAAGHVVAVADDRSNSVVISAPPDLMSTIDEMLDQIDRQMTDETELRVFRLNNADPTELADQISQLFPDQSNGTGNNNERNVPFFFRGRFGAPNNSTSTSEHSKKMGTVLAVADPRTASLIVTASKTLMPQIAEMISELDSNKGKKEVVSYFELQNADPQDVYRNLQDLFNRNTVHMQNNNNNNSLIGQNNPLTLRETTGNQQSTIGTTLMRSSAGGLGGGTGGALR